MKVTPWLFCMKDSPSAPMTFSMEVEPSVATVPVAEAAAEVWAEVAGAALVSWAGVLAVACAAAGDHGQGHEGGEYQTKSFLHC